MKFIKKGDTILVVYKGAEIAESTANLFKLFGYETKVCTDPTKIVDILNSSTPSLIFWTLPTSVDLLEYLNKIHETYSESERPIIFLHTLEVCDFWLGEDIKRLADAFLGNTILLEPEIRKLIEEDFNLLIKRCWIRR